MHHMRWGGMGVANGVLANTCFCSHASLHVCARVSTAYSVLSWGMYVQSTEDKYKIVLR